MTRKHNLYTLALAVLVMAAAGCASVESDSRVSNSRILTREEIVDANVGNLYEAVDRLRPRWMQVRQVRSVNAASGVIVYLNRAYVGGVDELRQFGVNSVERLRYLDGPTASSTLTGYPSGMHIDGAIILETNPAGR